MMLSWIYLMLAILFEVTGTTCMKLSQGFTRLGPSVGVAVFYGLAIVMLTLALRKLEVGIAYAIWAGLGTAIIALIGIVLFRESLHPMKFIFIALIVIGVCGLSFINESAPTPAPAAADELAEHQP